ncbi:MAG: ferredoxin domain-containing protein [Methanomassiliicoccales archaeon]
MEDAIKTVADLMAVSARTAPKAVGKDLIEVKVVTGDELKRLGDKMLSLAEERGQKNFTRDGNNVLGSEAAVLIGVKDHPAIGLNCGACGFDCDGMNEKKKEEFSIDFEGPNCVYRVLDMGIAIGSAVKTAAMMNVDNRVMYRLGVAAKLLGMMESQVVMGIPLSATGKSPYFDR